MGKPPPEWENSTGPIGVNQSLAAVDARLVFYDALTDNSYKSYEDYMKAHEKIDRFWDIFRSIDDFVPEEQTSSNSDGPLKKTKTILKFIIVSLEIVMPA